MLEGVEQGEKASAAAAAAFGARQFHVAFELQQEAISSWRTASEILSAVIATDSVDVDTDEPIDVRDDQERAGDTGPSEPRRKRSRRQRKSDRATPSTPTPTVAGLDEMIDSHVNPGAVAVYDVWVDRMHHQRVALQEAARQVEQRRRQMPPSTGFGGLG